MELWPGCCPSHSTFLNPPFQPQAPHPHKQGSGSPSLHHIQSFPACWWFCTQTGSHTRANDSLVCGPPLNIHISLKAQINTDYHLFACLSVSLLPTWPHCTGAPRKQMMFWFDVSLVVSTIPDVWSVQFSQSVISNSLQPHGLQQIRPPCPSPTPAVDTNSSLLSWWYHPTTSSAIIPFSCLQSFPASRSFPKSQLFTSGGQSIGVSASALLLPMNIQGWFPLGLTGLISLQSKGLSRVFPNTTVQRHQFFGTQLSLCSNSHIHTWLLEKP